MHFLFAWRYFRGKYNFQAIQMIAWVSVVAIAVGTAALIIVLSVSNGFTEVVKGLYADFYADVRVTPVQGKFFIMQDAPFEKIKNIDGVKAVSKVVESRALLVKGDLQYFMTATSVDDFIMEYQMDEREVIEQELNLPLEQKQKLFEQLNANLFSTEKYYTYKFIDKNCTTMVADKINGVFDKKMIEKTNAIKTPEIIKWVL